MQSLLQDEVGQEYKTRHKFDPGSPPHESRYFTRFISKMITDGIKEMIEQMNASEEITIHSLGGTSDGSFGFIQ